MTTAQASTNNFEAFVLASSADGLPGSARITGLREQARLFFEKTGLPGLKDEDYRHTPIKRALTENVDLSALNNEADSKLTADSYAIPAMEANHMVFINGHFSPSQSRINAKGLEVIQMADAINHHPEIVEKHFARYVSPDRDAMSAVNAALWRDGAFIHVPRDAASTLPLVLHYLFDATGSQAHAFMRNLILVDEGASLEVIEKYDTIGDHSHFSSLITEAVVRENGHLTWVTIQNDKSRHYHHGATAIMQKDSSTVNCFTFSLDGKFIRNDLGIIIDGSNCESRLNGLYLLHHDTLADHHTVVDHRKPNSFSDETYRGVIDDQARGVFNGKIYVRPDAQKTNAFQANRNILLSDKAVVHTKPQLEIWADDVKCSHGCTSGQLDEEAMFYLRSRGIPKEAARAMLLYAFVAEVFLPIKNEALRNYIDQIIGERLNKDF